MPQEHDFNAQVEVGRRVLERMMPRIGNIRVPGTSNNEVIDTYLQKILFYLPIDYGSEENNQYIKYLSQACRENYQNEKYQFSLMAYHMLFMSVLYKEFWVIKEYSHARIENLCRNNMKYNAINQVFDSSTIAEKTYIDDFLGVFSWHANKKRTYKEFVDKRDSCAHSSGFIQYDKEDVDSYFADVLRNIERVSIACEDSLSSVFSHSITEYVTGPSFDNTTMVDFASRQVAEKKYSCRDIKKLLSLPCPSAFTSEAQILSFYFAQIYLSSLVENAGYDSEVSMSPYVETMLSFWRGLSPELRESLQIQIEYEISMLHEKHVEIAELLPLVGDSASA